MTLRRRMLGYLVFAAIASCALTVTVAVVLVRHRLAVQRISNLQAQADAVAASGAALPGDHVYGIGVRGPRRLGALASAAVLAAVPPTTDGQGTVNFRGRSLLYVSRGTGDGRVVLVRSANLKFGEWRPFFSSLLLAGLGGALLAIALSYLLARRMTRPIARLSTATRQLAGGQPDVAVPVEGDEELAELAQSFNEMARELSRARESQRSFLESVSHELKTPLTAIRGYAEALAEHAVAPDEGARVIADEADRLERLVFDLLDLARFGRAGFAVAREPVDLAAVATQAVERHAPKARELSVALTSGTEREALALGDADRILQATSNLIENALRTAPAGGQVRVSVAPGRISVRDTGPGLEEEDLPRAFERFYLHRRYRSERPVGSGLGLAIVKELSAAMGGSVEISSPPGGGAEFTLRLPTPPPAPPGGTPAPPGATQARSDPRGAAQPSV